MLMVSDLLTHLRGLVVPTHDCCPGLACDDAPAHLLNCCPL